MDQFHIMNCIHMFSSCASALKRRVICRPMCDHKKKPVLIGLLLEFSVADKIKCLLQIL